ncbi:MAG TPA: Tex-like N-terminal domain-containing protein, partial [Gemmataceae bacterium]|nr:Tex-like N-terminal domain-containing protein [Gemmataceae bacterium]
MQAVTPLDCSRIAQDLQIRKVQVESVVQLLDEGNTVPFITRYRKERTGGLNEDLIRIIQERVAQLRALADRKQTVLKSIENQGKLTEELKAAILAADSPKRLEDLYLPYKPKKRSLATAAREKGLEPLALAIWARDPAVANLAEVLPGMVNPEKELPTPESVLEGVRHILAEMIAEAADVRAAVRGALWDTGKLCTSKHPDRGENEGHEYKDYFQFTEPIRHIPPHRILAINRGEKENALKAKLEFDADLVQRRALDNLPVPAAPPAEGAAPPPPHAAPRANPLEGHPHADFLKQVALDALGRLLLPSLEREIRRELTQRAEQHAVHVFARNLRSLLLAPPLRDRVVLAIDPGFRTGCKVAVLDATGNPLEDAVIYPHPPQNKKADARLKLEELVRRHQVQVIAIGNGTACRETEELVSDLIADLDARRKGIAPAAGEAKQETPAGEMEQDAAVAPTEQLASSTEHSVLSAPYPAPSTEAATEQAAPSTQAPVEQPALSTQYSVLSTQYSVLSAPSPALEASSAPEPPNAAPGTPTAVQAAPTEPTAVPAPGMTIPPHSPAEAVSVTETPAATAEAPAPAPAAPPPNPLAGLPDARPELAYIIVNEAGASYYSTSVIGKEEFPNLDATLRGTISIGRRLQDPLSELVKIDPQNVGVGLYQHDVNPKHLKESLEGIIESCVNQVGVDLNTASVPLLRHVSGLNQMVARDLIEYRKQHGPFRSREQLKEVPGIGEARFVQMAGFLKIVGGDNPLDQTWIHPESYPVARQLLAELGYDPQALCEKEKTAELREKLKALSPAEVSARLQAGEPTIRDIIEALSRPGRDPREDLPPPIFKKGILKLEDLQPGMELKGTVLNVVDFGAFVDIGLKDSGLVHISQMANRYIKSPYEVVSVGDVVKVWVLGVDPGRRRVSLTMIAPGTERKPPERRPPERRPPQQQQEQRAEGERRGGPPRGGRRPGPGGQRGGQRGGPQRRPQGRPEGVAAHGGGRGGAPVQAPPPPRRPPRPAPKPKLSKAALEGATPLRTLSELAAFWEAREKKAEPPPAAAPAPPPPP